MAQRTRTQSKALYGTAGTVFPDNTTAEISEGDMRAFGEDNADSSFNLIDDAYTGAKGQRAGATAPASLKDIVTVGMALTTLVTIVDSTASNVVRVYELVNETTAESSPTVIRPNDYAGTTNEKVWRLRSTTDVDSDTGGAGTVTSVSGTTNRVTSTGGATPVIDISGTFEALLSKVAQRIDQNNAATTSAQLASVISDELGSGNLVFSSAIIGVQDLFIPASAMWPRVTNGSAPLTQSELATSLFNIQSLDFDQTTQEFAQFQLVPPRKWNNGTLTAVFYWTASAGSGDVQWGISGGAYSNDDALTVAFGSAITVDDTLLATNDLHISSATAAITLAGTPADADFIGIQISRNPASDTLTGDAKLLGVSIRFTTDAAIDA